MKNQREISKKLFDESGIYLTPVSWQIWKRAFDLGVKSVEDSSIEISTTFVPICCTRPDPTCFDGTCLNCGK